MPVGQNKKRKTSEEDLNKYEAAKKDFDKLIKEIEPFMKKREKQRTPSSGEWVTAELLEEQA